MDTPLALAAHFGHTAAVKAMIESGADAGVADSEGVRPGDTFDESVSDAAKHAVRQALMAGLRQPSHSSKNKTTMEAA